MNMHTLLHIYGFALHIAQEFANPNMHTLLVA
jgi:hypothetical protein